MSTNTTALFGGKTIKINCEMCGKEEGEENFVFQVRSERMS